VSRSLLVGSALIALLTTACAPARVIDGDPLTASPSVDVAQPTGAGAESRPSPTTPGGGTGVLQSDAVLARKLAEDGMIPELAALFSTVRTQLVSDDGTRFHVRQELLAFGVVRDLEITIELDQRLPERADAPLTTGEGYEVYPLGRQVRTVDRKVEEREGFFIAYDSIDADVLKAFGVRLVGARVTAGPRLAALTRAPMAGLGIIVSAVTASSGNTGTYPPGTPPRGTDTTVPGNSGSRYTMSEYDHAYNAETNQILRDQGRHPDVEAGRLQRQAEELEARRVAQEAELASRRAERLVESSRHNPAGHVFTAGVAVHDLIGTFMDWLGYRDELNALDDCQRNPAATVTRRASPEERRIAEQAISDARSDVNGIGAARVLNTGAGAAGSLTTGGNAGVAMDLFSAGVGARLAETQRQRMADVRGTVVPCRSRYAAVSIAYSWTLSERADPPVRGPRTDWRSGSEIFNGSVTLEITVDGLVRGSGGVGGYRNTERGGYDCVTYTDQTTGALKVTANGTPAGFESLTTGQGQVRRVPLYSVSVGAAGEDLTATKTGTGFTESAAAGSVCRSPIDERGTAEVHIGCGFDAVALLEGGSFFSDSELRDDGSDPDHRESFSCRIDVRVLSAPPPPPPPAAPSDRCGPGRRC